MPSQQAVDVKTGRSPVLRPRAKAEELAALHPLERMMVRLIEFLASVRLAVVLMIWLMIECAIGTRIESTINAAAAKYFVYGNTRFYLLMSFLALNITFAALVRYPWKRYQTGFVVTHVGLLIILAGSMVTGISHIDALLNVPQGQVADQMVHPDQERLTVTLEDPGSDDAKRISVPVQFGPLTWGSTILGFLPWGKGHEEEISVDQIAPGAKLYVKRFIAHCDWQETFVEDAVGIPAVSFTLTAPEFGNFQHSAWVAAQPTEVGFVGDEQVDIGGIPLRVRTWRAGSQAELDHFVQAAPKGPIQGLIGQIGLSHAGKHYLMTIDELAKEPFVDESAGLRVELIKEMPHAQLNQQTGAWENAGDEPLFPAVILKVTLGDASHEVLAFANNPEFVRLLGQRAGLPDGTFVSYFRAGHPTELQLCVTPGEQLGYRAFGEQACKASTIAQTGKDYPAFGVFQFRMNKVLAKGRPELEIIPKPVPAGQETFPSVRVELKLADGTSTTANLVRRLPPARRLIGNKLVRLGYDITEEELPFAIRLDDFNEPKQPGTMAAARYESFVSVFEKKPIKESDFSSSNPLHMRRGDQTYELVETGKAEIKMNHPLFQDGDDGREYTLYQSGISRPGGTAVSTYTVAYDPGLITKYVGAVVLCVGIFLMFYMGGYFRSRPAKSPRPAEQAADAMVAVAQP